MSRGTHFDYAFSAGKIQDFHSKHGNVLSVLPNQRETESGPAAGKHLRGR